MLSAIGVGGYFHVKNLEDAEKEELAKEKRIQEERQAHVAKANPPRSSSDSAQPNLPAKAPAPKPVARLVKQETRAKKAAKRPSTRN